MRMPTFGLVEDLADLVADRVVDALDVELGGQGGLHAVDDGQLGVALLGDLEQALGLVEETRVLEGDAQAAGEAWSASGTSNSPKACSRAP